MDSFLFENQTHNPTPKQIEDWIKNKRYDQADRALSSKLLSEPDHVEALYLLGVSYYFQGKVGKAIEHLKKVTALDPNHTDANVCLSVLLNDIGKYDDAKKVFENANQSVIHQRRGKDMSVDRKFAIKHIELGDLYYRYRRYDEALEEYNRAQSLDPTSLDLRIRKAKAYAKKGFTARAIQELQQLKIENPSFLKARIQLGLLHYSQGNLLDAELEWQAVLDKEPDHKEAKNFMDLMKSKNIRVSLDH